MHNKEAMLMMLHTLTPTHTGSGTQLSYVDLPIQRESHTGFPKFEASTLKGCIRCAVGSSSDEKEEQKADINRIFGKPDNGDFASAVSFTDARLLFFPVKSAIGIFAWITCPYVIQRFVKDYNIVAEGNMKQQDLAEFEFPNETGTAICSSLQDCALKADKTGQGNSKGLPNRIMLEDYTYKLREQELFANFLRLVENHIPDCTAGDHDFRKHAILISDDDFCQFVTYSTEVATRIRINQDTGTVDGTALFTEEFLPPESILYSIVICSDAHNSQMENGEEKAWTAAEVQEKFCEMFAMEVFQIGSDSTLGKGFVKKGFWEVN